MYAKSFSILALAAASLVAAEDFTVATPPYVQQCAPLKISWKGGEPPYRPFITAPGKIDDVKASIDKTSDTTTTWKVTIPQGQKFTINVCDNSGQCQQSGPAGPVGKGDDSCMNGGDSKGGSSGGGSGGGAAAAGGGGSSGGSSGGDDNKSGGGDDNKSSSGGDDKKSSSSSDNKSSSSSGGKSSSSSGQSSTGGGSGGGSSSAQPSSTGMGGGSGSDDKSGQDNKEGGSDDNGGEKKGDGNGSMSFSGVPAVVAGVVGVVVAALI